MSLLSLKAPRWPLFILQPSRSHVLCLWIVYLLTDVHAIRCGVFQSSLCPVCSVLVPITKQCTFTNPCGFSSLLEHQEPWQTAISSSGPLTVVHAYRLLWADDLKHVSQPPSLRYLTDEQGELLPKPSSGSCEIREIKLSIAARSGVLDPYCLISNPSSHCVTLCHTGYTGQMT